jgi:hypothetical protein
VSRIRHSRAVVFAALLSLVASGAAAADDARYSVRQAKVVQADQSAAGDRYVVSGATAVATVEPRRGGRLTLESSSVLAVGTSCDASQGEVVFANGFE